MNISIIIPTADRPKLLDRAIQSIFLLNEHPSEIIIIDDGLTPIHPEYFSNLQICFPSIAILNKKTAGKVGPSGSRNAGVKIASGDIILFLDDDDEILPDYTKQIQNILKMDENIDFGFSNYIVCENNLSSKEFLNNTKRLTGYISRKLSQSISGLGCGFWIRKKIFESIGGLDEVIRTGEDIDLCIRLYAHQYKGWYESQPGVRIHRHHAPVDGISNTTLSTPSTEKADYGIYMYKKNSILFAPISTERWFLMERYIRRTVKSGLKTKAFLNLIKLLPDPIAFLGLIYWFAKVLSGKRYH